MNTSNILNSNQLILISKEEKKLWQKPSILVLSLNDTEGGIIHSPPEDVTFSS